MTTTNKAATATGYGQPLQKSIAASVGAALNRKRPCAASQLSLPVPHRARLRERYQPDCERRKIARRRTEEQRAEASFPLRETTTAADSTRDCASNHKQIGGCQSSRYAKRAPV
jgi:hypothetical protein